MGSHPNLSCQGASPFLGAPFVMAYYKYAKFLKADNHADFDKLFHPGAATPYTGIYRCELCGHEAGSTKSHPLPPEHHSVYQPTRWRLIAAAHPV